MFVNIGFKWSVTHNNVCVIARPHEQLDQNVLQSMLSWACFVYKKDGAEGWLVADYNQISDDN